MDHEFTDVVDHLRAHAGETLQAVVVYDDEEHCDLYRRADIEELHHTELEAELLAEVRADKKRRKSPLSDRYEGEHKATVRVFESRVVLHLPRGGSSGTIVLLDPAAARNLVEFVDDVRGDLYEA